jgi:hypothetical protein
MNYKVRSGAYPIIGHGLVIVDLLDEDDRLAHVIVTNPLHDGVYKSFHIDIHVHINDEGYLEINQWTANETELYIIDAINKIAKDLN